ncbi:MAG: DUF6783 domain-containing protein [Lacrimispora saccharolytica]
MQRGQGKQKRILPTNCDVYFAESDFQTHSGEKAEDPNMGTMERSLLPGEHMDT